MGMPLPPLSGTIAIAEPNPRIKAPSSAPPSVDPLQVLRQVLELERECRPTLDIDQSIQQAVANPDQEIVDSIGAVSVVCVLYGGYSPDQLIPSHLLTHQNFSTLKGLKKVIKELNGGRRKK
jgi:hypothetical protein